MILDDIVCKRKEQLAREMAAVPLEAVQKAAQNRRGILPRLCKGTGSP